MAPITRAASKAAMALTAPNTSKARVDKTSTTTTIIDTTNYTNMSEREKAMIRRADALVVNPIPVRIKMYYFCHVKHVVKTFKLNIRRPVGKVVQKSYECNFRHEPARMTRVVRYFEEAEGERSE